MVTTSRTRASNKKSLAGKPAVTGARKEQGISVTALEHAKIPPQALELEEAILGALMLEKEPLADVIDKLKPEHFYREAHQRIFTAIHDLFQKSEPTDMLTVTNQLRKNGELDAVGGPYYLAQLTSRIASTAHTEYHAHIVLQKYIQRELIRISSGIIETAYEDTTDVFDLMDQAEANLFAIAEGTIRGTPRTVKNLLSEAIRQIEAAKEHKEGVTGVPSGFTSLDRVTSGWQKSDLIIIASRPGIGKTSLVLSLTRNVAVEFNRPVAFFSLEMSAVQLVMRLIANETGLDAEKLRRGKLSLAEWEQLNTKISALSDAKVFIDDTPALSIFELRAKCRRLKAQHNIELVVVDYLQLMVSGQEGKTNREQEISSISRALKNIAKELSVPIIALSQLSRKVEDRTASKRPILSDLRESGAIEQDADLVIFIYRPEMHGLQEWEDGSDATGQAEIIISKHRNGRTGSVKLRFLSHLVKFDDMPGAFVPSQQMMPTTATVTFASKMNINENKETPF